MVVEDDGILIKVWGIRGEKSCHDQNRSVINEDSAVAMIGVIVVSAVDHHSVGLPFPGKSCHFLPVFARGRELSVVNINSFCVTDEHANSIECILLPLRHLSSHV